MCLPAQLLDLHPLFPNANLTIHAMPSILGTMSTQAMAPSQRWGQARVLRHAAPGIPRCAHMSQRMILCKQGVGFSFTFMHTRCALQTLCMLSAKIHTHIGATVKSIFALSFRGHVTLHICSKFPWSCHSAYSSLLYKMLSTSSAIQSLL